MKTIDFRSIILLLILIAPALSQGGEPRQFTFAWPYAEGDAMKPRGGTTRGPSITTLSGPTQGYVDLTEPGLSALERDRMAILAMAGDYRVNFDFLEVVGFTENYTPDAPYQSWGTERVYVIKNEPDFISLQHILVTTIVDDAGKKHGPIIVKHWRQDWRLGQKHALVYRGANLWEKVEVPHEKDRPYWVQTVWQVDDSPRYAGWGHWQHLNDYSTWISNEVYRPLPRREFSVRDDYDVLVGTNRHTVLRSGWVQEERNLKVKLDDQLQRAAVLAKEYGVARYVAIKDYDFSPGDKYWEASEAFWSQVREYWRTLTDGLERIRLKAPADQGGLFRPLFSRAQELADGKVYSSEQNREFVIQTINGYLASGSSEDALAPARY